METNRLSFSLFLRELAIVLLMLGLLVLIFGFSAASSQFVYIDF